MVSNGRYQNQTQPKKRHAPSGKRKNRHNYALNGKQKSGVKRLPKTTKKRDSAKRPKNVLNRRDLRPKLRSELPRCVFAFLEAVPHGGPRRPEDVCN